MSGTQIALSILFALFMIGVVVLLFDRAAVRDLSQAKVAPYSLSRMQLLWWTTVIVASFILTYALTGHVWQLNTTCLALLGISSGTAAAARIMDSGEQREGSAQPRHQDAESRGLLADILSDENGLSVHRFQSVIFHLFYGIVFLEEVFTDLSAAKFPTFDATTLTLLGVSSGTYLAIKSTENKDTPRVETQPLTSDELLDPSADLSPESN